LVRRGEDIFAQGLFARSARLSAGAPNAFFLPHPLARLFFPYAFSALRLCIGKTGLKTLRVQVGIDPPQYGMFVF